MDPLKDRSASAKGFFHFFPRQFAGTSSTGLKLRADVGSSQFRELCHWHAVKAAGMLVAEQKSPALAVKYDYSFWSMLHQGTEARFTCRQCAVMLLHPAFQRPGHFQ